MNSSPRLQKSPTILQKAPSGLLPPPSNYNFNVNGVNDLDGVENLDIFHVDLVSIISHFILIFLLNSFLFLLFFLLIVAFPFIEYLISHNLTEYFPSSNSFSIYFKDSKAAVLLADQLRYNTTLKALAIRSQHIENRGAQVYLFNSFIPLFSSLFPSFSLLLSFSSPLLLSYHNINTYRASVSFLLNLMKRGYLTLYLSTI